MYVMLYYLFIICIILLLPHSAVLGSIILRTYQDLRQVWCVLVTRTIPEPLFLFTDELIDRYWTLIWLTQKLPSGTVVGHLLTFPGEKLP